MDINIKPGTSKMVDIADSATVAAPLGAGYVSTTAGGNAGDPYGISVGGDLTGATNCYIPWQPYVPPPAPTTTITFWPTYPVMHPHRCPVCEGKETVPAGFYRDMAEDKGPQECRACKGKGIIYLP